MPSVVDAMAPPAESGALQGGRDTQDHVGWSSYLTAGTATLSIRKKPSYGSVASYAIAEGRATEWSRRSTMCITRPTRCSTCIRCCRSGDRSTAKRDAGPHARDPVRPGEANGADQVPPVPALARPSALPGTTHDALSVVLALRMLRLSEGVSVTFPVSDGGRVFRVQATVRERQRVSTRLGQQMAWRIEPAILGDSGETARAS